MKKIDIIINKIKEELKEANEQANESACGYDKGFYVGRADALEDVLKLSEENR